MTKKIKIIEPDFIKESIVEIKYTSAIPKKLIEGYIYKELTKDFNFSSVNDLLDDNNILSIRKSLNLEVNQEAHFGNEIITFKVRPNSIIFNITDNYPLWEVYFKEIKCAINAIFRTGAIQSFDRIGIRYINEYPNSHLSEIVNFKFKFNMPDVKSESYSFRSDFKFKQHTVILNLIDGAIINLKDKETSETNSVSASYVDVDVIADNLQIIEIKKLYKAIDTAHNIEKEIFFFNLLSQDFKDSLTIQY